MFAGNLTLGFGLMVEIYNALAVVQLFVFEKCASMQGQFVASMQ
jgi:hypothetical protein